MPSLNAARALPCPAKTRFFLSIRIGAVNPNLFIASASRSTSSSVCALGLFLYGLRSESTRSAFTHFFMLNPLAPAIAMHAVRGWGYALAALAPCPAIQGQV